MNSALMNISRKLQKSGSFKLRKHESKTHSIAKGPQFIWTIPLVTSKTVTYGSGKRFDRRYSILPRVGVHILLQYTAVYITFLLPAFKVRPFPVTARSKVWVCSRSLAGIAGSNPARCKDLSLVSAVLCQVERPLRKADHSSTGVLPIVICLPKCDLATAITRRPRPTRPLEPWTTKLLQIQMLLTGDNFGDQQQIIRLVNPTYFLLFREIIQQ